MVLFYIRLNTSDNFFFLGIADCITFMPSIAILREYFSNHLGLAMGLSHVGSGIGQLAGPPLFLYFIDEYGLKGTLLLWGGLQLHFAVCAAILRPTAFYTKRTNRSHTTAKNKQMTDMEVHEKECKVSVIALPREQKTSPKSHQIQTISDSSVQVAFHLTVILFQNKTFVIFNLAVLFFFTTFFSANAFLISAHASHIGKSNGEAAILTIVIGAGNIVGRPTFGLAADLKFMEHNRLFAIACTVECILLLIIPHVGSNMVALGVLSGLIGITNGLMITFPPVILSGIVSKEQYTLACGWMGVFMGVPSLFANPLYGKIMPYMYMPFSNIRVCKVCINQHLILSIHNVECRWCNVSA